MVDKFPLKLGVPFKHSSYLLFIAALPFPVAAGIILFIVQRLEIIHSSLEKNKTLKLSSCRVEAALKH